MPAWTTQREGYVLLIGLQTLLLTARNAWVVLFHDSDVVGAFTLAQSIIAVTSLMHFGLISGAYRQYASAADSDRRFIDSTTHIGLGFIIVMSLMITVAYAKVFLSYEISMLAALPIFIGLGSLVSAWANNKLIAEGRLFLSAFAMILGTALSLVIVMSTENKLLIIAGLALHPIVTILITQRPRIFGLNTNFSDISEQLIHELRLGIGVYLATGVTIAALHVDRFLVAVNLGESKLGEYAFPIFILTTASILISALNNYYYPKVMAVADRDVDGKTLIILLKQYQSILYTFGILLCILISIIYFSTIVSGYCLEEKYRITLYIIPAVLIFFAYERSAMEMVAKKEQSKLLIFPLLTLVIFVVLVMIGVAVTDMSISDFLALKVAAICLSFFVFQFVRGRAIT